MIPVVRMLFMIQYTAKPAGTFKLKKAVMKGKLLTIDCDISSCSDIGLLASLGAAITLEEKDWDAYNITGRERKARVSVQPSSGFPVMCVVVVGERERVSIGSGCHEALQYML